VAAGDGAVVQLWDVRSGKPIQTLRGYCQEESLTTQKACSKANKRWMGHEKLVTALAFSPDGELLASGSEDTTIAFWDWQTGKVKWESGGHWAAVTTLVFDAQGKSMLSGGADNKVRTWRLPGGKSSAYYEGHLSAINGVAFGFEKDTILSSSDDGTVREWETANQKTTHIAWAQYGLQWEWGETLVYWMLFSGLVGLFILWGLWKFKPWGHMLALILYIWGPVVILGLPLLETLSYPLSWGLKLRVAAPLLIMSAWYLGLVLLLTHESVSDFYESSPSLPLSERLMLRAKTLKLRGSIYTTAVWLLIFVVLYSVLRRFNLDIAFMRHWLPFIMKGSGLTIFVSLVSIVLAIILALLGALGRLSKSSVANGVSGFYISLIRGTPLLVQVYIWYLGLPRLGIVLQPITAGILALGVNYGAYMTEIFRAGIQAIGKGQYEAAEALGMTRTQAYKRIILPQAFRIVIPPIGNQFIAMMKDSSLVSLMSVWELSYRAQKVGRQYFRALETFIIAAAFYWILTVIFQLLQGKLEEYMARGERR
jgi:polar amino acid transport system permease protein